METITQDVLTGGNHSFVGTNVLLFCGVLIISVIIGHVIEKLDVRWLPSSGAAMIFGFAVGVLVNAFYQKETTFLQFDTDFFFFALLPPIVFEAGYSMKRTNFFKNLSSILLYAFLGTIISTAVIGYGLYIVAGFGWTDLNPNDILDPLTFGALISSIDPIATLAILGNKALNCDPLLYSLVFGESVLNDAVAITLYHTFTNFRNEQFTVSSFGAAFLNFAIITVGSVLIGVLIGLLCAFTLRQMNLSSKPSNEFILIFFSSYACYCVAEITHMSGIMSLFICGVVQAHYSWYNISNVSRVTTRHAFHSFSHLAENFLYTYLGISAFIATQSKYNFDWSWTLILWSLFFCILGRALNIFPLSWVANLGRKQKIPFKMQVVMWFAGLRGAISFALALNMDSPIVESKKFITTTIVLVAGTTLFMGGSSYSILTALGLTSAGGTPGAEASSSGHNDNDESNTTTDAALPLEHPGHPSNIPGGPKNNVGAFISTLTHEDGQHYMMQDEQETTLKQYSEPPTRHRMSMDESHTNTVDVLDSLDRDLNDARYTQANNVGFRMPPRRRCKCFSFHDVWVRFDVAYMQPLFGGRHAPRITDYSADHGDEDNSQGINPYLPSVVQVPRNKVDAQDQNIIHGVHYSDDDSEEEYYDEEEPTTTSRHRRSSSALAREAQLNASFINEDSIYIDEIAPGNDYTAN